MWHSDVHHSEVPHRCVRVKPSGVVWQVDALRPLKTKAASLELLEKELASKDGLIASLQRQASASARSSPGQHSRAPSHAAQHDAGAHRTSMEVITLQAEVLLSAHLLYGRRSAHPSLGLLTNTLASHLTCI